MTRRFEDVTASWVIAPRAYGAYGFSARVADGHRSGFSGGVREVDLAWYWLGDRIYMPALRRFLSADRLSPFERGGINRHVYCSADPINRIDPSGDAWDDWLRVGLGVLGAMLGASAGFRGAASGALAAGKAASAGVTAGNAIAATARVLETVTVVAAIGSTVALATEDSSMGRMLGWVAMGAGMASAGVALPQRSKMVLKGSPSRARAAGSGSPEWRSPAARGAHKWIGSTFAGLRKTFTNFLRGSSEARAIGPELPSFARFTAAHDPNTILLASRVPVRQFDIGPAVSGLKKEYPDLSRLVLASGTHGTEDPRRNYTRSSPNATRAFPEWEFFREDVANVRALAAVVPTVHVHYVGDYTQRDMETMLGTPSQEKRILVLNWCYSDKEPVLGKFWQFHSYV